MKRIYFIFCLLLSTQMIKAQTAGDTISPDVCKKLEEAYVYMKNDSLQNYGKAFKMLASIAKECPDARNTMGVMRMNGWGVKQNDTLAFRHFRLAAARGSAKAYYNVAMCYKDGVGVEQNFKRAYTSFYQAVKKGNVRGYYGLGYMYYKGFGVKQSYTKAVSIFRKGVKKGSPACAYFLGLCYLDGSGVEANPEYAKKLFKYAADKKHPYAEAILTKEETTAGLRSAKTSWIKGSLADVTPVKDYKKTKNLKPFEGVWKGTSYILDWSGKNILGGYSLELRLICNENRVFGEWIQNDTLRSEIEGELRDSVVIFYETKLPRLSGKKPLVMQEATFKLNKDGGTDYLSGNISLYSQEKREPYRPQTILLERQSEISLPVRETLFEVFPNPFSSDVRLKYQLDNDKVFSVTVYTSSGQMLWQLPEQSYSGTGEIYIKALQQNIPGSYILKVTQGKQELYHTILIKK